MTPETLNDSRFSEMLSDLEVSDEMVDILSGILYAQELREGFLLWLRQSKSKDEQAMMEKAFELESRM